MILVSAGDHTDFIYFSLYSLRSQVNGNSLGNANSNPASFYHSQQTCFQKSFSLPAGALCFSVNTVHQEADVKVSVDKCCCCSPAVIKYGIPKQRPFW